MANTAPRVKIYPKPRAVIEGVTNPMTTLGDIIYGGSSGTLIRLAGNTTATKNFLTQTGDGSNSAAPSWGTIVNGDVPSALTGKTYNALTLTEQTTGFTIAGGSSTSKTLTMDEDLVTSNVVLDADFVTETPSGSVNGSNKAFTVANTPDANFFFLTWQGVVQTAGGEDYTLSGTDVTMEVAPPTGSVLRAYYKKA